MNLSTLLAFVVSPCNNNYRCSYFFNSLNEGVVNEKKRGLNRLNLTFVLGNIPLFQLQYLNILRGVSIVKDSVLFSTMSNSIA